MEHFYLLLQILVCSITVVEATDDPPTPYDLNFPDGGYIKFMEWPNTPTNCYHQYSKPLEQILLLADAPPKPLRSLDYSADICLCEYWWPSSYKRNASQVLFNLSTTLTSWNEPAEGYAKCFPRIETESCTSFDEDDTCGTKLWLGSTQDGPKDKPYKDFTVLKCTIDCNTSMHIEPKYPVQIYKISNIDIGARCNTEKLIECLNYGIELYRKGSQFFWQIPIFNWSTIENCNACDPGVFTEGSALYLYYKCEREIPKFTDTGKHQIPVSRGAKSKTHSYGVESEHPCYELAFKTWDNLLWTRSVVQQETRPIPNAGAPVCVCEKDGLLTESDTCLEFVEKSSNSASGCSSDDDRSKECEFMDQNLKFSLSLHLANTRVSIGCVNEGSRPHSEKTGAGVGGYYDPSFYPVAKHAYLFTTERSCCTGGGYEPIEYEPQQLICWQRNNQTRAKTYKPTRYKWSDYRYFRTWNRRQQHVVWAYYEDALAMGQIWSNDLNYKLEHKRPWTRIQRRIAFDVKKFVEYWCPDIFLEDVRRRYGKDLYGGVFWELQYYKLNVEFECVKGEKVEGT